MRVTLQPEYKILTKPFNDFPPDVVVPFAEMIANKTADAIPGVPRAGNKKSTLFSLHELITKNFFSQ